jgi:hypothetical protein
MKKILALCAALALSVVLVVPAAAATNKGGNTTIPYSYSYTDPVYGPITCTGVHQFGKNWPGDLTTYGGRDSFTCTSSTTSPLTGVTAGQVVLIGVGGWWSDYFYWGYGLAVPNTIAFSLTVSSDGLSFSGVAAFYATP